MRSSFIAVVRPLRGAIAAAAFLHAALVPALAQDSALPAPGGEIPLIGSGVTAFTLGNGLEVVVIPDHRAPVVTHMVWYRVGSADEPDGRSGIAHFLEHLMYKGTPTHPGTQFSDIVSGIGGEENAATSDDYTVYHQRVAREHLGLMMELEADRMANLVLNEETMLPERRVVLEEYGMRVENEPGSVLAIAIDATLFLQHPYGVPTIGWRDEIEALTDRDAIAFYDRFYTPNNAVVVVAGDVEAGEVRRLAEATYGAVPRRAEPPPRIRTEAQVLHVPRLVVHRDARVEQASVQTVWLTPSYRTDEPGEAEALSILAEVLGGGTTSRLYEQLVVEQKLAVGAGAGFDGSALDPSKFYVYAAPAEGVPVERVAAAMDAVLDELRREGVTADEVARAQNRVFASVVYASDSQVSLANLFGVSLVTGLTVDEVQHFPERIAEVTPAAVDAALDRYLVPDAGVSGQLLPASDDPT